MNSLILLMKTAVIAYNIRDISSFMFDGLSRSRLTTDNFRQLDTGFELFGIKKGKLLSNIEEPAEALKQSTPRDRPSRKANDKSIQGSSRKGDAAPISSDLAKWALEAGVASETDVTSTNDLSSDSQSSSKKSTKLKKNVERRTKQAERKAQDELLQQQTLKIVYQLEELFEVQKNRDLSAILGFLQELIATPKPSDALSVRNLFSAAQRRDYRMVWVGSDDAICHIGTGLHKVPLARLQEVFLSVGKGYVDVQEVIRVLGPFPNVKNSLTGDVKILNDGRSIKIIYDRMTDGTGKELSAGKTADERTVLMDVLYASEYAIVCKVPNDEFNKEQITLIDDSASLLVFLPEPDLNAALEILRVA